MLSKTKPTTCTLGELMIYQISKTIEDGILAFHGFGSPLVQLALHLAKNNHAPNLILVAGATYGINPKPPFLTPTSNDLAMGWGAECSIEIDELFDLAASGRMGRMFLSGLQIDKWGNMNVTRLGDDKKLNMKLPGGGGGCNLSCDVENITIWTAAHRALPNAKGRRRYRLTESCDYITNVGHLTSNNTPRKQMSYLGKGPDNIVTDLALFDFDDDGHARLINLYPDTSIADVKESTGFKFPIDENLSVCELPDAAMIEFIRKLDPMKIHERELSNNDRNRNFALKG